MANKDLGLLQRTKLVWTPEEEAIEIWVVLRFDKQVAVVRKVPVGVVSIDFLGLSALVAGSGSGGLNRGDISALWARGFRFALGGHESEN